MVVPVVLCLTVTSHTKFAVVFTLNLQSFDMFECSYIIMFSFTKISDLNNLHCIFTLYIQMFLLNMTLMLLVYS